MARCNLYLVTVMDSAYMPIIAIWPIHIFVFIHIPKATKIFFKKKNWEKIRAKIQNTKFKQFILEENLFSIFQTSIRVYFSHYEWQVTWQLFHLSTAQRMITNIWYSLTASRPYNIHIFCNWNWKNQLQMSISTEYF